MPAAPDRSRRIVRGSGEGSALGSIPDMSTRITCLPPHCCLRRIPGVHLSGQLSLRCILLLSKSPKSLESLESVCNVAKQVAQVAQVAQVSRLCHCSPLPNLFAPFSLRYPWLGPSCLGWGDGGEARSTTRAEGSEPKGGQGEFVALPEAAARTS